MADDQSLVDWVLQHGIGYDVIVKRTTKLILGIRCHTCGRVSFHPKDIEERYCAACARFHDDAASHVIA